MLFIENGCIFDYLVCLLKIGLLEIVKIYKGDFCIMVNQNLIIVGVLESEKVKIEKIVKESGLMNVVMLQCENLMVCVLFLICLLVMVEAECFLLFFIDNIDNLMVKYGVSDEYIVMCVIGCLNGCGCVMLVEVGLVGKALGCYNLYFGGNCIGICILWMYKENIIELEILVLFDELIGCWVKECEVGEGFGDFMVCVGIICLVFDLVCDLWD